MDYGTLLSKSIRIAARHPSLWVFGLLSGYGSGFNFDTRMNWDFDWEHDRTFDLPFDPTPEVVGSFILAILLLIVVFIVAHLIAYPALIEGINHIARGGVYRFGKCFSRGIDLFWRMFGMAFVGGVVAVGIIVALVVPSVVFLPLLIITIPVGVAAILLWTLILSLGTRAMVVRDSSILDAINEGFYLFKSRWSDCLIAGIIYFLIAFGVGIVLFIIAWAVFGPLNLLAESIAHGELAVLMIGLVLGLPISLVVGGFTGVFFSSYVTLFYFELVDPGCITDPNRAEPPLSPPPQSDSSGQAF
ncbi:MAG: hypothetical protein JSU65_11665 [Candidatus Zixiibacteriota bacterium]|nr:MAG: hypothetical protein JSU65_11665 [candidate division Zixibacteria bacterium]